MGASRNRRQMWWRVFAVTAAVILAAADPGIAEQTNAVAYVEDGNDAHRLDLYLPPDRAHAPLVVFVHGGAFLSGDRRDYAAVGRALARDGMAVVVPSYRHFPQADAQGSTHDIALAVAWTLAHAREYGVEAQVVVLVGHSAGAQMVAMLGTHRRYLEDAGSSLDAVRGVFSLAGAYDVRDLSGEPDSWLRVDYQIYGRTESERAKISPGLEIDARTPFLEAVCGTADDPGSCPRTEQFLRALHAAGRDGTMYRVQGADHMGVLRALIDGRDQLHAEFRSFVFGSRAPAHDGERAPVKQR